MDEKYEETEIKPKETDPYKVVLPSYTLHLPKFKERVELPIDIEFKNVMQDVINWPPPQDGRF